jgi:CDP-diacylglycerol--serine O-phosphatidyltransferase
MFDGKIARTRKRTPDEKRFGIQIDSLCDVICFGVLPATIGYAVGMTEWYYWPILCAYPLCAVIRLAYYNVTEEARQDQTEEVRQAYRGLPVTSAAIIVPFVFCLHNRIDHFPVLYAALLVVTAFCFICPFTLRKPHKKGVILLLAAGLVEFAVLMLLFHVFK